MASGVHPRATQEPFPIRYRWWQGAWHLIPADGVQGRIGLSAASKTNVGFSM